MSDSNARLTIALAGRYRLERELGQGGMATVYLAEDLKHHRRVAIKVLRPELAAAIGPERFLREIETTAALRHPHIVPLYDSGDAGGFLYFVMPLVEGESLRDRLDREKQLPVGDALTIAREVADALGYAHSRGVVHRDIKPENILLEGGHAVVADFGIARAVSAAGADRLTQTGISVGTPRYMSPEQAAGDTQLDGRSDLYSLGCVLYEMLGGQPPFTGPTAESVARQHVIADAAPITNLRPTVSAAVAGALARTLAKNPADRFDLAARLSDAMSAADAVTPSGRATTARRPPVRLLLVAVGVPVVIAAAWLGGRALLRGGGAPSYERIAVLPLENQTGDSAQGFFADGMTREVIGVLTEAGVRVLGHRAVAPYRGSALPLDRIAQDLRVDAIVTGSVLQAGAVVQVAAELTDPRSNESLWARTFSRPAPEVVTLQRDVAVEIARGIRARLTPEAERGLGEARAVDPQAYRQFLLGQEQLNRRRPEDFERGTAYLQRSLALDSTYGPAWATLALAGAMGAFYGALPPDSGRALTERAADRALAIDPNLGDALIARGTMRWVIDWDFAAARDELRRGMERNPSLLAQTFYTYFPWAMGQAAEAVRVGQLVVDREPTTAQWHSDLGWDWLAAGDTAAARASALRAVALDSTMHEPYNVLIFIDADGGDIPAARRWLERHHEVSGDPAYRPVLQGYVMARAGDTAGARRHVRTLERDGKLAGAALVLAALGDKDRMYPMFGRAIDAREPYAIWYLNALPLLRPWRQEPRYQALLARMGMPEEWRR